MNERTDLSFGFTVGPVMPAERAGAAGDRERYRPVRRIGQGEQKAGAPTIFLLRP